MRSISIKNAIFAVVLVILLSVPTGFGCGGGQNQAQPDVLNEMAHEPMPVVLLSGTEYEMGYQYGQQLGDYLEAVKKQCWDYFGDTMNRDEVIEVLDQLASLTEETLPDVNLLSRFEGVAQGAQDAGYDITYEDALLCAFRSKVVQLLAGYQCSCVAVWDEGTADGKTIVGVNWDFGRESINYYEVVVVAYPDNTNAYITHGMAGKLGDNFIMNDKGLVIGMNSGQPPNYEGTDYVFPCWSLSPYVAMISSTAQEARDVVLDKFTGRGINWLIADADGNAYAVESGYTTTSEREPGDFGEENYLITTNFYLNPEMEPDQGRVGSTSDCSRYTTLENSVKDNYGQIDADAVIDMMTEVKLGNTLVSKVAIVEDKTVYFCHGLPGVSGWAADATAPTGQYVKIQMGDSVQSTADNIKQTAYAELTSVEENPSITDTSSAVEKLELLRDKYEEGVEYYETGCSETDMNDVCGLFGKAATLFAEVQAGVSYLKDAVS